MCVCDWLVGLLLCLVFFFCNYLMNCFIALAQWLRQPPQIHEARVKMMADSSSSSAFPSCISGVHQFGSDFCVCDMADSYW